MYVDESFCEQQGSLSYYVAFSANAAILWLYYREVSENGGESRMATEDEVEYHLLYYSCILVLNH